MTKYVCDDKIAINVQGLRTIKKEDSQWADRCSYSLKWQYKGQEGFQVYNSKAERDAMFEQVSLAIQETKAMA